MSPSSNGAAGSPPLGSSYQNGTEIFLKGKYIEVGIHTVASFGTRWGSKKPFVKSRQFSNGVPRSSALPPASRLLAVQTLLLDSMAKWVLRIHGAQAWDSPLVRAREAGATLRLKFPTATVSCVTTVVCRNTPSGGPSSLTRTRSWHADYDKNGYSVGSPPYSGDYFLPGDVPEWYRFW